MLLGTLGASLLEHLLTGKEIYRAEKKQRNTYSRKRNCKSWLWKQNGSLIPSHPLTNFEMQNYYENEPRFNGVYSRDKLTRIKDGAYITNLNEYSDVGTHWVALYVHSNNVTYFDSFGVKVSK